MCCSMKTIIIGIGNPILGDDGIGLHIIWELRKKIRHLAEITIEEAHTGGMNLLDILRGYDRAILIDAVSIKGLSHGEIMRFDINEIETIHSFNPHDVNILEAIELAKRIGDTEIPKNIIVIGVNLRKIPVEFSESLSPEVMQIIPGALEMILSELDVRNVS